MTELHHHRRLIDHIDDQILTLLTQRAGIAQDIAQHKRKDQIYRPSREADILNRLIEANAGPMRNEDLVCVYRAIISACRGLEATMKVAFLGPLGTHSQAAVHQHFGENIDAIALDSIEAVFDTVHANEGYLGVVPVENSTEGGVSSTLKGLFEYNSVRICGEIELRIRHCLMSQSEQYEHIKAIHAHPQALGQCKEWLHRQLPDVRVLPVGSTAAGAQDAASDSSIAAIASQAAAHLYKLNILAENIEDADHNTTRFLIIGQMEVPAGRRDKTSLLVSAYNEPGSLMHLMQPLVENGIDLSWLQSWPYRKMGFEYLFFIDCSGHQHESKLAQALATIKERSSFFRILGSYPKTTP